jgi:Fe-S cluster biogenesis protein NfuA
MEVATKTPVLLYTEQTPNPESLKFVTNRMLYRGTADFREETSAKDWSPLASALFDLPYVKGVYISNNFVTISKEFNYEWAEIMLQIKDFIKNYVEDEKPIISDDYADYIAAQQSKDEDYTGDNAELVRRIKDLIDTYVKPAVEMDGGNIEFKSFDKGTVNVILQGSCSGCPSSTVTLKSGIEGMLTRMIPEVKAVEAEMG